MPKRDTVSAAWRNGFRKFGHGQVPTLSTEALLQAFGKCHFKAKESEATREHTKHLSRDASLTAAIKATPPLALQLRSAMLRRPCHRKQSVHVWWKHHRAERMGPERWRPELREVILRNEISGIGFPFLVRTCLYLVLKCSRGCGLQAGLVRVLVEPRSWNLAEGLKVAFPRKPWAA